MKNLKFKRCVEIVGSLPVDRKVIETAVAERHLVSKVGVEVVARIMGDSDDQAPIRHADAMDFRECFKYMADIFQEMICVNDGKLVARKGPWELIEIVNNVDSWQPNPIDADAARGLTPAAPDVQRLHASLRFRRARLRKRIRRCHAR